MKILWVSHFLLYPETGYGALQRSRNLLIELCKRHDVYLISYYRKKDLMMGDDRATAQKDLRKYCKEVILLPHPLDNVRFRKYFILIKSLLKWPYSTEMHFSKILVETVVNAVKQFQIELLHSDTIGLVERVVDRLNCQKTLNHHNIESDMMFSRYLKEKNILKKLFFLFEARKLRTYEIKYCPLYDMNLTVSRLDEERLLRTVSPLSTSVIANGVDCNYFQNRNGIGFNEELIFFGSLDWYPNADAMIYFIREIWPTLKTARPQLRLTIIGKNPPEELRSLILSKTDINHVGFVKDVRSFVRQAKIFICPIRDGGGTRLKILDALAQGIPIVSTQVGAEGLGLEPEKHILIADTPKDFISQIQRLLNDDNLCMELSKNGRHFIENNFCYTTIGEKLSSLYKQIVRSEMNRNKSRLTCAASPE